MFPACSNQQFGERPCGSRFGIGFEQSSRKALAGSAGESEEKRGEAKGGELKYRDRRAGGMPGLLPLVLNLPVQFADAIDREAKEQGVFNRARGIHRGWGLPGDETGKSSSSGGRRGCASRCQQERK